MAKTNLSISLITCNAIFPDMKNEAEKLIMMFKDLSVD